MLGQLIYFIMQGLHSYVEVFFSSLCEVMDDQSVGTLRLLQFMQLEIKVICNAF